jgi:hypothetical protein
MSKTIRYVIVCIMFMVFLPLSSRAESSAVRLMLEDFDSQTVDEMLTVFGNGWRVLSLPEYNLDAPGRNGTGHCFSSGTERSAHLAWNKGIPNPWPTDEMYVSFWMRYPTFTPTNPINENIKLFYPHWHEAKSYVHYSMTGNDKVYYSACASGTMLTYGNWLDCPGQADGNWHHYEFYVNFAQGISRFWYDGVVKADDTFGTGVWTKDMYYITAPSIEGNDPRVFSRQVDDWEIWNGMPDPAWLSGNAPEGS